MGTVFVLNSVALFLFPIFGHLLGLTQNQFGIWSAIAIHDTSSVVGASAAYGPEALVIATTVKLARALWIAPVALMFAYIYRKTRCRQQSEDRDPVVHFAVSGRDGSANLRFAAISAQHLRLARERSEGRHDDHTFPDRCQPFESDCAEVRVLGAAAGRYPVGSHFDRLAARRYELYLVFLPVRSGDLFIWFQFIVLK